ncbi:ABC transporter ATP-binding protein [Sporomusa malonica]|uniref:Amino acid/amide ABC transporter ATP-binding protein 1, HAAT family n=1 Tax=Sporomusa malonica TaxID=112901 RepID=A0A1W2C269_9FIRM|nr:ABC transporter ATP-binding protein [Sporomusa malonica]SMC79250.1 amino acid/amide ABC transporter ATP-binding protein 1, HAAT family [Sporomusa malonica]
MNLLELKSVTKAFGGIMACRDVSFATKQGQIMGLIGPNGAGKTTMFNLITGVYAPTSGSILFEGQELVGRGPDGIVAQGVARTFQNIRLFRNLSVLDNVCIAVDKHVDYSFAAALLRLPSILKREQEIRDLALEYLTEVGLADKANVRADSLPYGLQRKLEIARALALKPKLLLLDEPAAGMNPEESLDLAKLIRRIHQRYNLTILLIEHHMDVVMELCDTIFVLNFGLKLAEGTAQDIQSNPDVLRAYLGEGYKRVRS